MVRRISRGVCVCVAVHNSWSTIPSIKKYGAEGDDNVMTPKKMRTYRGETKIPRLACVCVHLVFGLALRGGGDPPPRNVRLRSRYVRVSFPIRTCAFVRFLETHLLKIHVESSVKTEKVMYRN